MITMRHKLTAIRSRAFCILAGLAGASPAFGLSTMAHPPAYACIAFKPGTAILSEAGKKTLDNFADLIKRGPQHQGQFQFQYFYSPDQADGARVNMPDLRLAFAREQALLSALSARFKGSAVPNTAVLIRISYGSAFDCQTQIVSPFGYTGRCDENGCSH